MKPWERQPGERSKAFYAFTIYRDLGYKRSLTKVAGKYSTKRKLQALINRWSSQHHWVQRVQAYDEHVDRLVLKDHEQEVKEMKERHITLSLALEVKAAEKLNALSGQDMTVQDAIKAISLGVKLERLTRGQPTEEIKSEVVATIHRREVMPWELMPEAQEAMRLIRDRLRREKAVEEQLRKVIPVDQT